MAISKVTVKGKSTTSLDSKGYTGYTWVETGTASPNDFTIDNATATAALTLTGTTGDKLKINGYSGDYTAVLSGAKLTLQSNTQTIAVTLAKASTVTLSFIDGDKPVNVVNLAKATLGSQLLKKTALLIDGVSAREAKALALAATTAKADLDAAVKVAVDNASKAIAAAKIEADKAIAAAKVSALTDLSGKVYATLDAAIISNDTTVINTAISTATGSKITTLAGLTEAYAPTFSVSADAAVVEGADAVFTVKLNVPALIAASVNIDLKGVNGAAAGTDYNANGILSGTGVTASGTTLTFAAGATMATVKFPVLADSISPETGEGLTLALTAVAGSSAKVSTTAASSTIGITDVIAPATPVPVSISSTNVSAIATSAADTFNIAAGSYDATITGFGVSDKLVFAAGASKGIINSSATDGNLTITANLNSQLVTIQLTGISPALDGLIGDVNSFNAAFGTGSLV